MPADLTRLFVIEQFPAPPETLYVENFDDNPVGWTTGAGAGDTGTTVWELGTPSGGEGPGAAQSALNCYATNLDGPYGIDTEIWLRSPPIDLTGVGAATLNYNEWRDIEVGFDSGKVTILDAADDSEIAEIADSIDALVDPWELTSYPVPTAALGKMIKIEWRFAADNINEFGGWHIDDVSVTVP